MGTEQILLLIIGVGIFILSFIIPEKKTRLLEADKKLGDELVRDAVEKELDSISSKIEIVFDDSIEEKTDKVERALERLSNEKIMAVNEYSDTVLREIKRNHDEVVFLYDMLNEKQKIIKTTAIEAEARVKEASKQANEDNISSKKNRANKEIEKDIDSENNAVDFLKMKESPTSITRDFKPLKPRVVDNKENKIAIQFSKNTPLGKNSNDRILGLHKQGKSNMAIAKELGLGIGEVKLVIDLFNGM